MVSRFAALLAAGAVFGILCGPAHAGLIISEFTGDDIEMELIFTDAAGGGVDISAAFTAASTETGDIRAIWLGIDDALFDPALIMPGDATVTPGDFSFSNAVTVNLGGGDNLNGGAGLYFDFDLDIAVQQDNNSNQMLTSLLISINTADLMASYFNAAGARVRSSSGAEGSSKLLGGSTTTQVPEPGTLSLLGAGLLALGFMGARRRRTIV